MQMIRENKSIFCWFDHSKKNWLYFQFFILNNFVCYFALINLQFPFPLKYFLGLFLCDLFMLANLHERTRHPSQAVWMYAVVHVLAFYSFQLFSSFQSQGPITPNAIVILPNSDGMQLLLCYDSEYEMMTEILSLYAIYFIITIADNWYFITFTK